MRFVFWENWIVLQPERILLRKHIQMLIPSNIKKMLDVGGGSGSRYKNLFNAESYICLDIDPSLNPDVVASADNIPFLENTFDFIFSSQMLEHVEYPRKCIREMHRVLDVNGHLLLTVPQTNELHSEPQDYWRFTNYGVETLLKEVGFKIISSKQRGNFPTVIAQLRIRRWIDSTDVYNNKKWLLLLYPISILFVKAAEILDILYKSEASKKHTLGWTYLAQKV